MDFMLYINEKINPLQSIITLSIAIFISSFFGISKNVAVKKFIITVTSISLISAFYLNIYSYASIGNFSNFLLSFETLQMIEVSIILFSSLNLLFFISRYNMESDHFVKILILFLFSIICAISVVISKNFLLIFISFCIFILTVFQLVASLNLKIGKVRPYVLGYFLRPALAIILFFFGFSLIYGATDFKNFKQLLQSEAISNPLIALSLVVFGIAIYMYFFLFPFQSPYLKLIKRCEFSSSVIIWFLYFPVGIFMFMKLDEIFIFFIEKNNLYISILFMVLAFVCMFAGNLGAIKTNSLRRIMSFLFLYFIGILLLNISMFSTGLISRPTMEWLNIVNIFLLLVSFLPLYCIFSSIEKNTGSDSIGSMRGFIRSNIYMGINLVIIILSWCGLAYYIKPFLKYFKSVNFLKMGIINIIVLIIVAVVLIFLIVNIFRIIVHFFKTPEKSLVKSIIFPRVLYIYVTFFTLVIVIAGILVLLETLNVDIKVIDFKITEFNFLISIK